MDTEVARLINHILHCKVLRILTGNNPVENRQVAATTRLPPDTPFVLPALKPNHPNQSKNAPRKHIVVLCPLGLRSIMISIPFSVVFSNREG
mmetsp:Transcript_27032/g.65694  ORF Transcript_27032/g.65694 Transcript_27032/m.65694 type:complete len:92 (-) Transcript_27032:623-898(-)